MSLPLELTAQRRLASKNEITAIATSHGRLAAVAAGIYGKVPEIAIWDLDTLAPVLNLPAHGVVRSMVWSGDDRILITGRGLLWTGGQAEEGHSIFFWDTATGAEMLRLGAELYGVSCLALSPDGRLLASATLHGKTRAEGTSVDLWDAAAGKHLARLADVGVGATPDLPFFTSVEFSADGAYIFAGCDRYRLPPARRPAAGSEAFWWWNRSIRCWRLGDGQEFDFPTPGWRLQTLRASADGTRLFAAGNVLAISPAQGGVAVWERINASDSVAAASADCRFVARGVGYKEDNHGPFVDTALELYDGADGRLLGTGRHATVLYAIAFTASGAILAGGDEGDLRLWARASDPAASK